MKSFFIAGTCLALVAQASARAEIKIVIDHNDSAQAASSFRFKNVPPPSKSDAATKAEFALVDGRRDRNGGDLDQLHDGRVPSEEDQPAGNFFFEAGTSGGRILVDLGSAIDVRQINTYSWHADTRAPQVYRLYGSDGKADGFDSKPKKETDPEKCGWKSIVAVDTRSKDHEPGGQYGVSISDSLGDIGKYRYLLFEVSPSETADPFGNTFYSEIDIVDRNAPQVVDASVPEGQGKKVIEVGGGKYHITIDTSETPDLAEWVDKEVVPMAQKWYPKIAELLPSEGYEAPATLSIVFSQDMKGVAATGGTRIRCAASWFRQNLKGEAVGAIFHELVHVVQQYGRARRNNPNATRTPGWIVEGIPDYLRWYVYEPQSHGAEITKRNISRARYDGSYRITANFLNWVTEKYDKDLIRQLNAAAREGKYDEALWKTHTGKSVQELGDEWKAEAEKRVAAQASAQ